MEQFKKFIEPIAPLAQAVFEFVKTSVGATVLAILIIGGILGAAADNMHEWKRWWNDKWGYMMNHGWNEQWRDFDEDSQSCDWKNCMMKWCSMMWQWKKWDKDDDTMMPKKNDDSTWAMMTWMMMTGSTGTGK